MLSVLVLETLENESPCASGILGHGVKQRALPVKRLVIVRNLKGFAAESEDTAKYNVIVFSLKKVQKTHVEIAIGLRSKISGLFVVFVLSDFSDVEAVARPSVQVSGILFAPPEAKKLFSVFREIYSEYLRVFQDAQSQFVVKSGSERAFVNLSDICFFESRAKKIALKTLSQEILFYSNFEKVMEQLPASFVRCHKGFVVNSLHIKSFDGRGMSLTLRDGSCIPVSRSGKQAVVEVLEGSA